jgi:hypothetical protein
MVRPQAAPRNRSWRLRSRSSGAGWVGSDRIGSQASRFSTSASRCVAAHLDTRRRTIYDTEVFGSKRCECSKPMVRAQCGIERRPSLWGYPRACWEIAFSPRERRCARSAESLTLSQTRWNTLPPLL